MLRNINSSKTILLIGLPWYKKVSKKFPSNASLHHELSKQIIKLYFMWLYLIINFDIRLYLTKQIHTKTYSFRLLFHCSLNYCVHLISRNFREKYYYLRSSLPPQKKKENKRKVSIKKLCFYGLHYKIINKKINFLQQIDK